MASIQNKTIECFDEFQPGVGWSQSIMLLGHTRFQQSMRLVSLSDEVSIGLHACRGSFHVSGQLGESRIQLLFIETLGNEISRVQSHRHITDGACLSFGGNTWEAVSDRHSTGIAINLSGSTAEWIKTSASPAVRSEIASQEGSKPALASRMTPLSHLLKRRLVTCAAGMARQMRAAADAGTTYLDLRLETQQQVLLELTSMAIEELVDAPAPGTARIPAQRLDLAARISDLLAGSPRDRHDEWSLLEVAEYFRVSPRVIQMAMQEAFGVGFTGFRKLGRLHQLRRALSSAPPGTTITDLAHDHFFANPGRMAGEYRSLFGSMPSHDLASMNINNGVNKYLYS